MLDLLGRIFLVIYFLTFFAYGTYSMAVQIASIGQLKITPFVVAARLPTLLFVGLSAVLTIIRLPPVKDSIGWSSRAVAVAGTFIISLAVVLPRQQPPILLHLAAAFLGTLGIGLSIYCLAWLGRSFSIDAQARRLVTRGPYSIVRHPLYLCECIGLASVPLDNPTVGAVALYLCFVGLQFWRAKYEEKILSAAFEGYTQYMAVVPMLVPRSLSFRRRSRRRN